MTRWSLNGLLLYLLCVLCGLLCKWVLCLLCGLCTKLSTFKMKATLANVNPTASATSLYLCCPCLSGCPLSLLGSNLLTLATSNLCQPGRTLILVTRCTTSILAMNHADESV
jgi:hypothetical protein